MKLIYTILLLIPLQLFAQLSDQAVSFSYKFGFGQLVLQDLSTEADMIPQSYIGGNKWCRSNEFDVTWHFIPNLGATFQIGGSAYVIDQEAFEGAIINEFANNDIETMMPKAYKTMDISIGPTGFWTNDELYVQGGALFGMQIQRKNLYDVYLWDHRGYPSHTYQFLAKGPLGWVGEANLRAGFLADNLGFFIGGNFRHAFNKFKIEETHFNAIDREVDDATEEFDMNIQSWQIQLGVQIIVGG